jgi:hypothetical protein
MKPSLTERGLLWCPACGGETSIPVQWNANRNQTEKLVLIGGRTWRCPVCGADLHIGERLARAHNHFWYPDDPRWDGGAAVEESLRIEYTRRSRDGRQRLELRITSEGQPLLPALVRAVRQIAGPAADQLALELDEGIDT